MRWPVLLTVACLGVASCGGSKRAEESQAAANADLFDAATVNAILGADIPPEELLPANGADENAADENAAEPAGNTAD